MPETSLHLLRSSIGLFMILGSCSKLDSPSDRFDPSGGSISAVATGGSVAGGAASGGTSALGGSVESGGGDAGPNCTNSSGLNGLGCYGCPPYDIVTLESACTWATCTPFKNLLRLTKLTASGQLPALPNNSATGGASSTTTSVTGTGGNQNPPSTGGTSIGGAGGASVDIASGGGLAGTGGVASSLEPCDALSSRGKVIYVTGSSAAKPFLQQIAQQLSASNVYVVYTSTGSCAGVDAILNGTRMTTGPSPAPATSAAYWDSTSSAGTPCLLPSAGVAADLGISDVFAQTCPGFELSSLEASQVREAHGPIQTMTFAVPSNSIATDISAQAAYFVFGFGADGGVLDADGSNPIWNDEAYIFQRSASSGTQAMIAAAIGVSPGAWRGKAHKSSDDVAVDLQTAGMTQQTADKALGILAADYIDSKNLRAQIRVLAYQDSNQPCAFYPDSTVSSRDKRNVRDGHYPIWSPLHVLYRTDSTGSPLNVAMRSQIGDIIGYLSGTKVLPNGMKLIDVYAQSGLIPECAMHVTRQKDGGNILPFSPTSPCSCLFEFKATGSTTCAPCTVQGDCGANETCSLGFCEK